MSLNARSYLFDAGALSLFYQGEQSLKIYFDRVFHGEARGYVSEVNLAEFYYKAVAKKGVQIVDVWYRQIRQSSLLIAAPNETITRSAGLWKVKRSDLSLADCFALATAQEFTAVILTTDSLLAGIKEVKSVHISL